jgi:hypothetical protein
MTTLILRRGGALSQWWRALGLDRAGLELDLRMWLVTIPAVALAVITVPALQVSAAHHWLNGMWRFVAMFGMATLCSLAMMALIRFAAARGRRTDVLLSCWWISAGAAVWLSTGWAAAIAGAAGAAVLLHLMVRQLATVKLDS